MIKPSDRVILRTIDGKVVVRPEMSRHDNCIQVGETVIGLSEGGIEAWNSGKPLHEVVMHSHLRIPLHIMLADVTF